MGESTVPSTLGFFFHSFVHFYQLTNCNHIFQVATCTQDPPLPPSSLSKQNVRLLLTARRATNASEGHQKTSEVAYLPGKHPQTCPVSRLVTANANNTAYGATPTPPPPQTMHHLPAALQATAHGPDGRMGREDRDDKTHHSPSSCIVVLLLFIGFL